MPDHGIFRWNKPAWYGSDRPRGSNESKLPIVEAALMFVNPADALAGINSEPHRHTVVSHPVAHGVTKDRFLERSNRITEVRLTPNCLAMARLLIPRLRSCFISGTSLPAVIGRPCGFPSLRA